MSICNPPKTDCCVFRHPIETPLGKVTVQYELPAPETTEQFLAMWETMIKHFPPAPEQLAEIARRESAQWLAAINAAKQPGKKKAT
jgi:hypothetical protein